MKSCLWALLTAFFTSLLFCKILIPLLKKWKAGQNILSYVKEHKSKGGTPTMGGLAFVLASVVSSAFFLDIRNTGVVLSIVVGLAYMLVGLLDDGLKKKHKQNLGLKAWQKLAFQTLVATLVGAFCFQNGLVEWYIPLTNTRFSLGRWVIPLTVLVFLSCVNAVNLTDGLDGLAAGVSVPFFLGVGVLIFLERENIGYSVVAFAIAGALIAYLIFNSFPASVFMGDTGSLALGGFASSIACFTGNALYIVIIGFPFVLSVISVVIQVIYYKATGGKRVFLMSPIHHHYQQKGYSETKISYTYGAISLVLAVFCIAFLV